jgi:hypothetical protein
VTRGPSSCLLSAPTLTAAHQPKHIIVSEALSLRGYLCQRVHVCVCEQARCDTQNADTFGAKFCVWVRVVCARRLFLPPLVVTRPPPTRACSTYHSLRVLRLSIGDVGRPVLTLPGRSVCTRPNVRMCGNKRQNGTLRTAETDVRDTSRVQGRATLLCWRWTRVSAPFCTSRP